MAEQENNPSTVSASEYGGSGIDFDSIHALANNDYKTEPFIVSFRNGLLEGLLKLGLFLFGVILDVLKTLWAIVTGLITGIYRGIFAIARYLRGNHRRFCEVDGWGKASFFLQGLGQIKYGQVGQGVIFMGVELAFVGYMAAIGVTAILNLFALDAVRRESPTRLILGIMTIIIVVAYWVVWQFGVRATHDAYQILHNFDFRVAREKQIEVLKNHDGFDDNGKPLTKLSHMQVKKLMREKYGYSRLTARYISYVDFKRVPERRPGPIVSIRTGITRAFYKGYKSWRDKVKAGKWSNAFADYLEWEPIKEKPKYGYGVVLNELESGLLVYHHTYDKYNDFHAVVRDSRSLVGILNDPEMVLKCVYAEDPVSIRNGIKPIDHGKRVSAKEILPRVVGYFEVTFEVGRTAARMIAKALTAGYEGAKAQIAELHDAEQQKLDLFLYENEEKVKKEAAGIRQAYQDYDQLQDYLLKGKKEFLAHLLNTYGIGAHYASMIFEDFSLVKKGNLDPKAEMPRRVENFEPVADLLENYSYHGQPTRFKKQIKQFADEKFAVTILALPTLGAVLTCIIPLIFSITIAFTNWDKDHTAYRFNWDLAAWGQVFGMGERGGDFATAFGTLLVWTLIWAFFATFTNYIFGIIMALLINKKGIKFKSFWRTCFVLTIAIPQFITLLSMSLLFGENGPVNEWLLNTFGAKVPFLSEIRSGEVAFDVASADYLFIKFMIVLINMWVGIPYTILSTSGILMNIPEDLYESASIDGATPWTQFWKITMPYILFVTGPSLLTTFIGNINNFNVIYFLSGGGPNSLDALGQVGAGHTDLLITWLYKITASRSEPEYAMGSVIGILMFAVCAFFSLIMYKRMGSVQNEEEFQ